MNEVNQLERQVRHWVCPWEICNENQAQACRNDFAKGCGQRFPDCTSHEQAKACIESRLDREVRPIGYVQRMGSYQGLPNYGCLLTTWAAQRMKVNDPLYGQTELDAAIAAERERCAAILDAEADRQEAAWNAHLASGQGGPATSFHAVPRAYAARIRGP